MATAVGQRKPPKVALLTRDAFLYMDPHANSDPEKFAQCAVCRMFVPESAMGGEGGARCVAFGSSHTVKETGSCGVFVIWPSGKPDATAVAEHAAAMKKGMAASTTPEEAGYVDRPVRCDNCEYFKAKVARCGLYEKLNATLPAYFDLDSAVHEDGCCNANMERR